MVTAIQQAPRGYIPPNRKKLSGPLLDSCYEDMLRDAEKRDPDGLLADKFGIAYAQDGRTALCGGVNVRAKK